MRDVTFRTEIELASRVVAYLTDYGWDVYQEVQPERYGPVIDIVATQGSLVRIIECKLSLTAALIEQAMRHRQMAHYTHIATPSKRPVKGYFAYETLLRHESIGWLAVSSYNIREQVSAKLNRRAWARHISQALRQEHKTFSQAGSANGDYFTPFKDTCRRWKRFVEMHPGCTLKEIIAAEGHHYICDSTARSSMAMWIREGKVRGIRADYDRVIRLYPEMET